MKRILALMLAVALLLCSAFLTYALAEDADNTARAAPLVDLTGVVVSVVLVVFDFLLAWIARVIVPPIKKWLDTHTTQKQRGLMWDAICELVDAAEQIIKGPGQGERRMAYVEAGLKQRGYTINRDMIEAAVLRMNERVGYTIAPAFGIPLDVETETTVEVEGDKEPAEGCAEKDYCDLDEDGNPVQ